MDVEMLRQLSQRSITLDGGKSNLALKAGVWLRRGLLLIVSPVRGYHRRYQAETPLIDLFKFAVPALTSRRLDQAMKLYLAAA